MEVTDEKVKNLILECQEKVREMTQNNAVVLVSFVQKAEHKFEYDEIAKIVCSVTGVPLMLAMKRNNKREFVLTRHLIAYYGKSHCNMNSVQLADKLKKDHTTILSSFKKVNNWLEIGDPLVCEAVFQINSIIQKLNHDRPSTTRTPNGDSNSNQGSAEHLLPGS